MSQMRTGRPGSDQLHARPSGGAGLCWRRGHLHTFKRGCHIQTEQKQCGQSALLASPGLTHVRTWRVDDGEQHMEFALVWVLDPDILLVRPTVVPP